MARIDIHIAEVSNLVLRIENILLDELGGFSTVKSNGGYTHDDGHTVTEASVIVSSYGDITPEVEGRITAIVILARLDAGEESAGIVVDHSLSMRFV